MDKTSTMSNILNTLAIHCIIMPEPMEITTRAYEVIERPVKSMGNSGGIYLPKDWIGKMVKILLIEPLEQNK
jgi:putative transposon-encoded protein